MQKHDSVDLIDIEEVTKAGGKIPESGVIYFVRIDKHKFEVPKVEVTGRELLEAAKKSPDTHDLYQYFVDGRREKIGLGQTVNLCAFGIERFKTLPREQTDGLQVPRRDFELPAGDVKFLEAQKYQWETVNHGGVRRLVINNYRVPVGFNVPAAMVSLVLVNDYPEAQVDMAYFYPALKRADGKAIPAVTDNAFDGKTWQQWSRHRTAANPWRAGVDDISTHLGLVDSFLEAELKR